jgi:serine/threonine protein kinase
MSAPATQAGAPGPEISEPPAPPGTSLASLLLDRKARTRDPSFRTKRGGFGAVSKFRNNATGQVCAVKELAPSCSEELFFRELEILRAIHHPNVLGLIGYYPAEPGEKGDEPFALVTEWMPKGSLDDVLHGPSAAPLTETQKMKIIVGIILGVRYLHKAGIMHRDLKPGNILLTQDFSPKVGDLGSARLEDPGTTLTSNQGTAAYLAPEITEGVYGRPVDIFAFGIMVWEIVTGEQPYKDLVARGALFVITQIVKGVRPDTSAVPKIARNLMEVCWRAEPDKRWWFQHIFDSLICYNYDLPPGVDVAEIKRYVNEVRAEETKHPPPLLSEGLEISESPAPPGTSIAALRLDWEARTRDPSHLEKRSAVYPVSKLRNKATGQVSAARSTCAHDAVFFRELEILRQLHHPNFLGVVGYCAPAEWGATQFALVTEWMPKGSLEDILHGSVPQAALTETDKVKIVVGIVLGMRYLHRTGLTHGALMPSHILLTEDLSPKICDLGCSKDASMLIQLNSIPPDNYMAPEVVEGSNEQPIDVFSFGIMVWEIATGERPYKEFAGRGGMYIASQILKGLRPDASGVPEPAKRLIEACWQQPGERPSFEQIFDRLKSANYQLLPGVDAAGIKKYVDAILAEEAQHPPVRLDDI